MAPVRDGSGIGRGRVGISKIRQRCEIAKVVGYDLGVRKTPHILNPRRKCGRVLLDPRHNFIVIVAVDVGPLLFFFCFIGWSYGELVSTFTQMALYGLLGP